MRWLFISQEDKPYQKTTCQHLVLELLAFRTVRNAFLLFKQPSMCYFVMAEQADKYKAPALGKYDYLGVPGEIEI